MDCKDMKCRCLDCIYDCTTCVRRRDFPNDKVDCRNYAVMVVDCEFFTTEEMMNSMLDGLPDTPCFHQLFRG